PCALTSRSRGASMQDERQTQGRGKHRAATHADKADAPQLSAARQPGDAGKDCLKIVFDDGEVGARLIGLTESDNFSGSLGIPPLSCGVLVSRRLSPGLSRDGRLALLTAAGHARA